MKRILCYGDSNTWGSIPGTCNGRYEDRFPKLLQKMLGDDFEVVEEGLRARTTCYDDVKMPKGNRNGAVFFGQCVWTHDPLDYVVVFLGTNDLKTRFNSNPAISAENIEKHYIKFLRVDYASELIKVPKFVIIAPSVVKECFFDDIEGAEQKSLNFNEEYKKMALRNNCIFIDNDGLQVGSDGIHLLKHCHQIIAKKLAKALIDDCK